MPEAAWQLLFVDDEPETCDQIKEGLDNAIVDESQRCLHVETLTDFDAALGALETRRFDLLIIDVRMGSRSDEITGEEAGIKTLDEVKQRRFVPVIFYTNLPGHVIHLETPDSSLIRVVEKTRGIEGLLDTIREVFSTSIPGINRALVRHVESVQRDYMWSFVADNWEGINSISDHTALAYLLSRRLARSLAGPGITQFTRDLGDESPLWTGGENGRVHPMIYYIMPPVVDTPLAGDIYKGRINTDDGYWVLLTPSCDIVNKKAEYVLVAQCDLLSMQKEYTDWYNSHPPTKAQIRKLEDLIGNNRSIGGGQQPERYHFLPGALDLPDLIVDFQKTKIIKLDELSNTETFKKKASLDSPYGEAILARFSRYFGRLGTPDIDSRYILDRLRHSSA